MVFAFFASKFLFLGMIVRQSIEGVPPLFRLLPLFQFFRVIVWKLVEVGIVKFTEIKLALLAKATAFLTKAQVAARKWMSFGAVTSLGVQGASSDPTSIVFSRSNGFNVDGVDAVTHSAQVVANQVVRHDRDNILIHQPMCRIGAMPPSNRSVAIRFGFISPLPTRNSFIGIFSRYFNFGKEFGEKFSANRESVNIVFRHIISLIDSVFRLAEKLVPSWRAVSILAHREVFYRYAS